MESSSSSETPSHSEIAALAQKIYRESGCVSGRDVENWLLAEAQLKARKQQRGFTAEEKSVPQARKSDLKTRRTNESRPGASQLVTGR